DDLRVLLQPRFGNQQSTSIMNPPTPVESNFVPRLETGIPRLDSLLGGGLIPGTLAVVFGATGIGKSQLGVQFAHQGHVQEAQTGVLLDLTSRGDSQNHREYARRLFGWDLREMSGEERIEPESVWNRDAARSDLLHLFERSGLRVSV